MERPEPFQSPSVPAISTTGLAEALDEPRCDDADHTLVPVLSGDDVCTSRALVLRPLPRPAPLPHGRCAPRPPDARGSSPRACLRAGAPRRRRRSGGARAPARGCPSRPAALIRGPRRKPHAPRVDRCRIDSRSRASAPGAPASGCARARAAPPTANARFSSTSGTTSAIVASATRSRCLFGTSESTPKSAWPSL